MSALRSGAFRLALVMAVVFAAGSSVLLWAVQRQVGGYAASATDDMLRSETAILSGEYRSFGRAGLLDALVRHSGVSADAPYRYLLVDPSGRRLFGTLPMSAATPGWGRVKQAEAPHGELQVLKRLGVRLVDGSLLVVATDTFDVEAVHQGLLWFVVASGVAITLFALTGGYLAGRIFLVRLDRVNRAVERIIDGDQNRRLPHIGVGPEFDHLTRNLNRMLERKAAAMDALREVSTAIAHDLRTPLTRLHQLLDRARESEPPDRKALDDAVDQAQSTLDLFQALLRIGMLEGGVGRQRFAPVALSGLLDRVHQIYKPVAEDAGRILAADHQAGLMVEGDADLLLQLFANLVENAIVHTGSGARILTRLERRENVVVASVCDDGPGVSPDDRQRLFQKFFRGEGGRNTPGSGLGLALVAAVADLHEAAYSLPPTSRGLCVEVAFMPAVARGASAGP